MQPSSVAYTLAIQHPSAAFSDLELRDCTPVRTKRGLPHSTSGTFAVTYHLQGSGGDWAVRCFIRDVRDVKERYAAISRFMASHSKPYFLQVKLVPDGIFADGAKHDFVKMQWFSGEQLGAFVAKHFRNADAMRRLAQNIIDVATQLETLGIAHGDLQHGNIMVAADGNVVLVDYDDMWLPELATLRHSSGLGHPNYQHPQRSETDYNSAMDRFSVATIVVSIVALVEHPELWELFAGGEDQLLFCRSDYSDPRSSEAFCEVGKLPGLGDWIDKLSALCEGDLASVPSVSDFLAGNFHYARRGSASTAATTAATIEPEVATTAPAANTSPADSASRNSAKASHKRAFQTWAAGVAAGGFVLLIGYMTSGAHRTNTTVPLAREHRPDTVARVLLHPTPRATVTSAATAVTFLKPTAQPLPVKTVAPTSTPEPKMTPSNVALPTAIEQRPPRPSPLPEQLSTTQPAAKVTLRSLPAVPATVEPKPAAHISETPDKTAVPLSSTEDACSEPDRAAHVTWQTDPVLSGGSNTDLSGATVSVAVALSAKGAPTSAAVTASSGDQAVDHAAIEAALHSTFTAATHRCTDVPSTYSLIVRFGN